MQFVQGVHLLQTAEDTTELDALQQRFGQPCGIPGVLHALNRQASLVKVPGRAPRWGFTWNKQDNEEFRWWPQGISTSADASESGDFEGRRLIVVSWYSKGEGDDNHGSRVTFVDIDELTYRHVLIVQVGKDRRGRPKVTPLKIHAGGVVWAGKYLHLAGTRRGLFTCHVDDIMRVEPSEETYGYRFVLPVRFTYTAHNDDSVEQLRYSFLSLDRAAQPPQLVAGEYGVTGQTTRLIRYPLAPETMLLHRDEEGASRPVFLDEGVGHMQGAAVVGDTYYVTVSRGMWRLGYLYVGRPGRLRARRWALPAGPEDISFWPARNQFWSVSEYPGRRYVYAMDRDRLKLTPGSIWWPHNIVKALRTRRAMSE